MRGERFQVQEQTRTNKNKQEQTRSLTFHLREVRGERCYNVKILNLESLVESLFEPLFQTVVQTVFQPVVQALFEPVLLSPLASHLYRLTSNLVRGRR